MTSTRYSGTPAAKYSGPPAASELAISVTDLRKSYGAHVVLDGIDLSVPKGSIFCLLGPNGAGKTTTVQILSTLIAADSGRASIAGHDLFANPAGYEPLSASPASSLPSTAC